MSAIKTATVRVVIFCMNLLGTGSILPTKKATHSKVSEAPTEMPRMWPGNVAETRNQIVSCPALSAHPGSAYHPQVGHDFSYSLATKKQKEEMRGFCFI